MIGELNQTTHLKNFKAKFSNRSDESLKIKTKPCQRRTGSAINKKGGIKMIELVEGCVETIEEAIMEKTNEGPYSHAYDE